MNTEQLLSLIANRRARADRGCKTWSTLFHASFGISTLTGVLIAAMSGRDLKLSGYDFAYIIPFIALIGSICSAIGIFGGFERKWRANRITRNELDILTLQINGGDNPPKEIAKLVDILRTHDAAILQDIAKPAKGSTEDAEAA